jgi:hypothetical protein
LAGWFDNRRKKRGQPGGNTEPLSPPVLACEKTPIAWLEPCLIILETAGMMRNFAADEKIFTRRAAVRMTAATGRG